MAATDVLGSTLGGINWGGGTLTFIKWFFWPVLIGLGAYAIWWFLSYKVEIVIHNPKGNGSFSTKDKGKRVRDKKTDQIRGFQLLRNKKDYSGKPIDESFFQPVKKFLGVGYRVHMVRDEKGRLQPVRPPNASDVVEWEGMDDTDVAWAVNEARTAIDAYATDKSKWAFIESAAPWIGLIIVVVLMLVLMRQMEGVVAGLNGVASQLDALNVARQVVS